MKEQLITVSNLLYSTLFDIQKIVRLECSDKTEETLLELFPQYYNRSSNEALWEDNEFGMCHKVIPVIKSVVPKGKIKIVYKN